ncbi:MAG TPA: VOC family protein [Phycisphaerae bacterium]|nr:VOC family protein [Phycisphaerae bacterium]
MSAAAGFHHVAMRVADFDASVRFYTEALGMTAAYCWGEGDKRAVLLDAGNGNYIEVFAGGKPAEGDAPLLHLALRSDDVDGGIERARAAGATVTVEPKDVDIPSDPVLPVRIAFCKGPAGETIEFFHER